MKRILRFTASWCGPCKSMAMNLETANLGFPIEVVDIDAHPDVAQEDLMPRICLLCGEINHAICFSMMVVL